MRKSPRIFISYARKDRKKASELYNKFLAAKCDPWMDSEKIQAGETWKSVIRRALRNSECVVVLLSKTSIRNRRNFKFEVDESLALLEEKPRGTKFIFPLRLDKCSVPQKLAGLQYVDLFGPSGWSNGWSKLLQSLRDEIDGRVSDKISHVTNRSAQIESSLELKLPSSLTTKPFAYPRPRWLTESQQERLSEVAKAAFVLLLFEQTETGCWGKSYLPRHLSRGETLPLALGAITGTPFALLAISSYAAGKKSETGTSSRTELLVHESTDHAVFKTLARLLQPDGSYLRGHKESYTGRRVPDPERSRHEAGACLIRMLYGEIEERDLKTIERLCKPMFKPETYDFAVVSRLFFQVPYLNSIPLRLQSRVARRREKLLAELVREIHSAKGANIAGGKSSMRHESINQWSTAWYVLPLLTLPSIPSAVRAILINRVRQFFLDRSAASLTEASLLPTQVDESFRGDGKSAFGSGLALISWRILERMVPKDKMRSKQAQKIVDRIVDSTADVIKAPMFNPGPETPEGYLGWGAICLGAASVGIRISYDDCHAAITLTKQLNDELVDNRSEKELERAYIRIIKKNKFVKPELAGYVARAAARLSFIYEPVRRAKKEAIGLRA